MQDLSYISIHNVRDYIPDPQTWPPGAVQHLEQLATSGIHFNFIGDCNSSFSYAMQELDALVTEYPGIARSVEGPNEINNFPCYAGSGTNQQQATTFQKELYAYVHGDSKLKNIPVLYMTGAAPVDPATTPGLAMWRIRTPMFTARRSPMRGCSRTFLSTSRICRRAFPGSSPRPATSPSPQPPMA